MLEKFNAIYLIGKKVHSKMNGELEMIKKTETQATKDRYHVLLNAVAQRQNFILSTYSVGQKKTKQTEETKKTLFIFRSIFQCFYFTWRICIHGLFAFHIDR